MVGTLSAMMILVEAILIIQLNKTLLSSSLFISAFYGFIVLFSKSFKVQQAPNETKSMSRTENVTFPNQKFGNLCIRDFPPVWDKWVPLLLFLNIYIFWKNRSEQIFLNDVQALFVAAKLFIFWIFHATKTTSVNQMSTGKNISDFRQSDFNFHGNQTTQLAVKEMTVKTTIITSVSASTMT